MCKEDKAGASETEIELMQFRHLLQTYVNLSDDDVQKNSLFKAIVEKSHAEANESSNQIKKAEDVKPFTGTRLKCLMEVAKEKFAAATGCQIVAMTVRERSGYFEEVLRPTFGFPLDLNKILRKPIFQRFEFKPSQLGDRNSGRLEIPLTAESIFYRKYRNVEAVTAFRSIGDATPTNFLQRIGKFLSDEDLMKSELGVLAKAGECHVFALAKSEEAAAVNFVAFYTPDSCEPAKASSSQLCSIVDELLLSVRNLSNKSRSNIDSELLRLSLRAANRNLADREVWERDTPSQALATLTTEIGELLRSDPFFGSNFASSEFSPALQIWFVNISFFSEPEAPLKPNFKLYPRDVAKKHPVAAYLVNHDDQPTIVEFLLHKWAETNPISLKSLGPRSIEGVPSIKKVFADRDIGFDCLGPADKVFKPYGDLRKTSLLATAPLDAKSTIGRSWDILNCSVDGQANSNQSIAAFLLFHGGSGGQDSLPFGALVFESESRDAFSETDFKILDSISKVVTSTLTSLKVTKSTTNFLDLSRKAHQSDNRFKKIGSISFGRFSFELERLDEEWLTQLWNQRSNLQLGSQESLALDVVYRTLIPNLPALSSVIPRDEQKSAISRRKWIESNSETLRQEWSITDEQKHTQHDSKWVGMEQCIIKILEACPSNPKWHCYHNAAQRLLASRSLRNPELEIRKTGFSASNIFLLSNRDVDEMRQVLKFGDSGRIEKEYRGYRNFVRYKIAHAARIPISEGVAFESTLLGDQPVKYGAIISDLVGGLEPGDGKSWSILDEVFHAAKDGIRGKPNASSRRIVEQVFEHFQSNTASWKNPKLDDPNLTVEEKEAATSNFAEPLSFVRDQIIRLKAHPYKNSEVYWEPNSRCKLVKACLNFEIALASKMGLRCSSLRKFIDDPSSIIVGGKTLEVTHDKIKLHQDGVRKVIHGDLNSRNLTWSSAHSAFFMIDFEHVKIGFHGCDELKLLSSLLTELASYEDQGNIGKTSVAIQNAVSAGIRLCSEASSVLWSADANDPKAVDRGRALFDSYVGYEQLVNKVGSEDSTQQGANSIVEQIVWQVLRSVFGGLVTELKPGETQHKGRNTEPRFWAYLMVAYFYKHVEYGFRGLELADLDVIKAATVAVTSGKQLSGPPRPASFGKLPPARRQALMFVYSCIGAYSIFQAICNAS
jgi:hypothetical protein